MEGILAGLAAQAAAAPAPVMLALVFLGGVLSSASPCVLAAVPLVVATVGGTGTTKARAAANCARVARCVMSPDSSSTSGRCSRTRVSNAATTGARSVPKCGSDTCSSSVMPWHAPVPAWSAGSTTAAAATRQTPAAAAARGSRHPWPP